MIDYNVNCYLVPLKKKNIENYRLARNDPSTRNWCRQVGEISQSQQERWFESQDKDPTIQMFEINIDDGPVGVCGLTDIDFMNRRAEFSLYVFPEYRKQGIARSALTTLVSYGFYELNLNMIWGETFQGNPAAYLFEKLGFKKTGFRPEFYYKNGEYLNAYFFCIKADEWIY